MQVERLLEPLSLPHVSMQGRAVVEGVDPELARFRVLMHKQFHPRLVGNSIAKLVHGAKFPGRVDVQ